MRVRALPVTLTVSILAAALPAMSSAGAQQPTPAHLAGVEVVLGRWNLTLLGTTGPNDVYTAWLEIQRSGFGAVVGRYVGLIGGARPIGSVVWDTAQRVARFSLPAEWEAYFGEMRFEVRVAGDSLSGMLVRPNGTTRAFVGKRAPILLRATPTAWTAPVPLFNGRDLSGWTAAPTARSLPNSWLVRDGILVNTANEGANLMTIARYQDFKLHAEYRLPPRGTSGIFPRGRYWVILGDRADTVPFHGTSGAVHKFLVPNEDAARGANVWHAVDITLVGRRLTVVINGKTVIADQIIPGTTGSAIDSDEAAPGPIMLQGEETRVEFRNITISVPARS